MNIITAIGNTKFNEKLKNIENINVIGKDIQYKEGIIEVLELFPNINLIFLSDILPGMIDNKELILKIKKINKEIEIVYFFDKKKEEMENFLISEEINKIYYFENFDIEEFFANFLNKKEELLNRNN